MIGYKPLPFIRAALLCSVVIALAGAAWWAMQAGQPWTCRPDQSACEAGVSLWRAKAPRHDLVRTALLFLFRANEAALVALAVINVAYAIAGSRRCLVAGA